MGRGMLDRSTKKLTKVCNVCGQEKHVNDFKPHHAKCNDCKARGAAERAKQRREALDVDLAANATEELNTLAKDMIEQVGFQPLATAMATLADDTIDPLVGVEKVNWEMLKLLMVKATARMRSRRVVTYDAEKTSNPMLWLSDDESEDLERLSKTVINARRQLHNEKLAIAEKGEAGVQRPLTKEELDALVKLATADTDSQ